MEQIKTNFVDNMRDSIVYGNAEISIIEELKLLSDLWLFESNSHVSNLSNCNTSGVFMSTVIKELYFILFYSNNQPKIIEQMINDSKYKDEIDLYNKICSIAGINAQTLLFSSNNDNRARKFVIDRFFDLTKDKYFWNKLEHQLDLFIMNRDIPKIKQSYLDNINIILKNASEYSFVSGQIDTNVYSKVLSNKLNK